jgi:hypothetical protein
MDQAKIKEQLKTHSAELVSFKIKSLAVFGSVARGEARADSDIDFLVEFEGTATFDRYMGLKFFLEDLLGRRVDLVTRQAIRRELAQQIEQEARRVA